MFEYNDRVNTWAQAYLKQPMTRHNNDSALCLCRMCEMLRNDADTQYQENTTAMLERRVRR